MVLGREMGDNSSAFSLPLLKAPSSGETRSYRAWRGWKLVSHPRPHCSLLLPNLPTALWGEGNTGIPCFSKFTSHHFAFMEDLCSLTKRNPKRISFLWGKKTLHRWPVKIAFSICFAARGYRAGETGVAKLLLWQLRSAQHQAPQLWTVLYLDLVCASLGRCSKGIRKA